MSSPATPSATSVVPCRHARPNESLTITPTSTPVRSRMLVAQSSCAEASGSTGRRITVPGPFAFDAVDAGRGADEAVARLGDQQRAAGAEQLSALPEDDLDSTRDRRRRRARGLAPTAGRPRDRRRLPSTLETAFCATTTTSPCFEPAHALRRFDEERSARSSPSSSSGIPRSGMTRTSRLTASR